MPPVTGWRSTDLTRPAEKTPWQKYLESMLGPDYVYRDPYDEEAAKWDELNAVPAPEPGEASAEGPEPGESETGDTGEEAAADDPADADVPAGVSPAHYRKLRASGLSPDTVRRAGIYTEHDATALRRLLRGIPAAAPALILPGFGPDGGPSGYDVARMMPPHRWRDGTEAKYLAPRATDCRAYFPPLPAVRTALDTPGATLVITEGILKALAAAQAGVACLGLMGVENWSVKRPDKSRPRVLTPDLASLDWAGRTVLVVFDADPERKPGVNHAAAELARVLTAAGADVRIPRLPPGPRGDDGRPAKQAIDDYVVRHGEVAFRRWVEVQCAAPPIRSLADWRREMIAARTARNEPGVYLDTSPTGTGKSYADAEALRRLDDEAEGQEPSGRPSEGVSLTLVPTHANCREVVDAYVGRGLDATAYPQLTSDTCARYDEAEAVLGRGLPHHAVLCPDCAFRDGCDYRAAFAATVTARHAVATQARAAGAMEPLTAARAYITVHENPLGMLRPTYVTLHGLKVVELVARQAEHSARKPEDRLFYRYLRQVATNLDGWHHGSTRPTEVPLPDPAPSVPGDVYRALNRAVLEVGAQPPPEAMKIALGAVLGQLSLIAVGVDEHTGPGNEVKLVRSLVGVSKTDLPPDAVVWINDATASRAEVEAVLGHAVRDVTPRGLLGQNHQVLQIVPKRDVTKDRDPRAAADLLRGILHDLPHRRVGLLTHQKLARALPPLLGERYQSRLAMVEYFGGGLSRGSNRWLAECDAVAVLGTPRVAPSAIREHLLRLGNVRAALRGKDEAQWEPDWWSGVTESGRRVTAKTPHYRDHDWHAAYCSIVRGELIQAVGRGRGTLPAGIPVYLVTTENLAPPDADDGRNGSPLADRPFGPLTAAHLRVLDLLGRDGDYRGREARIPVVRSTAEVATHFDVSRQAAHKILAALEKEGRVRRIRPNLGWYARP